MPTIGVAVPCYSGHAHYIPSLLQNITTSTVKPDEIVISCSSSLTDRTDYFECNSVPVTILYSTRRLNQSTNRNRAAKLLKSDLISFIDADDLMHPRRIELLLETFQKYPDISVVYHNYSHDHISARENPFWEEPELKVLPNKLVKDPIAHGLMVLTDPLRQYGHHHAHVTVRREVFDTFKFDEDWSAYRIEDSTYGALLFANNVPMLYLHNKLSRYTYN
jgi:glycosyltransferase involved in cell wall biosynthesis